MQVRGKLNTPGVAPSFQSMCAVQALTGRIREPYLPPNKKPLRRLALAAGWKFGRLCARLTASAEEGQEAEDSENRGGWLGDACSGGNVSIVGTEADLVVDLDIT